MVAPKKTKVMVITTREMEARRNIGQIEIRVGGHSVKSTKSERLLGLTLDNNLSWTPHIKGEVWRPSGENEPGLLNHLKTRAAAVKRLMWVMTPQQLKIYIEGTVNSTILYCLPVWCNSWGVGGVSGVTQNSTLCSKDTQRCIQVLQNKVMRCLVRRQGGATWDEISYMGTEELVKRTDLMSVNQMTAFATITATYNIMVSGKPKFVAERLVSSGSRLNTLRVHRPTSHQLKITGEGFLEKAVRLWNWLPVELRKEPNKRVFKSRAKNWIKQMCPPKPP